jgi:hypothetical protein
MQIITLIKEDNQITKYTFTDLPDVCPFCGIGINPIPKYGIFENMSDEPLNRNNVQVVFQCPIANCRALFITQYHHSGGRFYKRRDLYKTTNKQVFDKTINDISPDFVTIFNQSYQSEEIGLTLVSGPGYRKSLEFLIKDYVTHTLNSDEVEAKKVHTSFLGDVINKYIDDARIKSTAKRAAWLGNDETHYLRKWEEKDLKDLKLLIEMTTNWILLVELSKKFEIDMPEK